MNEAPSDPPLHTSKRSRSSSSASSSSLGSIFESSLTLLGSLPVATAASKNRHGEPVVIHKSNKFGKMRLALADVNRFEEVRLQSHYLWPAGVKLAEMIEDDEIHVQGETVLELGAGAALPSLIAAQSGASRVAITDYPAPAVVNAIEENVSGNLRSENPCQTSVAGLDWANPGRALENLLVCNTGGFTRILAADTLWISSLHEAQLACITSLLARNTQARVHVMAGLHSGRACVRQFLHLARTAGLRIVSNHGRGREWDRLEQRWLDEAESTFDGIMPGCKSEATVGNPIEPEDQTEGTEESRRRFLVYFELGWADEHLAST